MFLRFFVPQGPASSDILRRFLIQVSALLFGAGQTETVYLTLQGNESVSKASRFTSSEQG
jgi:hypothetical protein